MVNNEIKNFYLSTWWVSKLFRYWAAMVAYSMSWSVFLHRFKALPRF